MSEQIIIALITAFGAIACAFITALTTAIVVLYPDKIRYCIHMLNLNRLEWMKLRKENIVSKLDKDIRWSINPQADLIKIIRLERDISKIDSEIQRSNTFRGSDGKIIKVLYSGQFVRRHMEKYNRRK